jgi:hypothetical protein
MEPLSSSARNVTECPFCKELVSRGAIRCPHCHANLKIPKKVKKTPFWMSSFMVGFYTATLLWLFLIILYIWKS